jgi:hypothetical protein
MSEAVERHRRHAGDTSDRPVPLDAYLVRPKRGAVFVAKHQGVGSGLAQAETYSEF